MHTTESCVCGVHDENAKCSCKQHLDSFLLCAGPLQACYMFACTAAGTGNAACPTVMPGVSPGSDTTGTISPGDAHELIPPRLAAGQASSSAV